VPETPEPTETPSRVGSTLAERWRLEVLLGEGGMGAVYAARHRNGKRVAIKILHPELARNATVRRRFQAEGYAANRVEHPGAVSVLDDGTTEDGVPFLVMELLEGTSVADRAAAGPLSVTTSVEICLSVLDVLAAAHERGVVHRDVKPENVFLTRDGRTMLLDFGIARLLEDDGGRGITRSGVSLGTPAYMSPEQAAGRLDEIGPRSDLYSVGAMLFGLLAGRPPHVTSNVNEALVAAATKAAPPLASVFPDAPPEVAAAVDRALAFVIADRFPNARAMRRALALAIGQAPPAEPSSNAATLPDPASSRRTPASASTPTSALASMPTSTQSSSSISTDRPSPLLASGASKRTPWLVGLTLVAVAGAVALALGGRGATSSGAAGARATATSSPPAADPAATSMGAPVAPPPASVSVATTTLPAASSAEPSRDGPKEPAVPAARAGAISSSTRVGSAPVRPGTPVEPPVTAPVSAAPVVPAPPPTPAPIDVLERRK
jgi:serine/threonine-protein kinase